METYLSLFVIGGIALVAAGGLWLLFAAFQERWFWGVGMLLLYPLIALIFVPTHWQKAARPFWVMLLGGCLIAGTLAFSVYQDRFIAAGPVVTQVDQEEHVTLTGWDQKDYSMLKSKTAAVVLQMANPDVTDDVLEYLRDMTVLRELDLNDTQVTDQGLLVLKGLPKLQELRLRNTKITDAGFKEHLGSLATLNKLDLRGTKVGSATARAWKAAKEGREYLK